MSSSLEGASFKISTSLFLQSLLCAKTKLELHVFVLGIYGSRNHNSLQTFFFLLLYLIPFSTHMKMGHKKNPTLSQPADF